MLRLKWSCCCCCCCCVCLCVYVCVSWGWQQTHHSMTSKLFLFPGLLCSRRPGAHRVTGLIKKKSLISDVQVENPAPPADLHIENPTWTCQKSIWVSPWTCPRPHAHARAHSWLVNPVLTDANKWCFLSFCIVSRGRKNKLSHNVNTSAKHKLLLPVNSSTESIKSCSGTTSMCLQKQTRRYWIIISIICIYRRKIRAWNEFPEWFQIFFAKAASPWTMSSHRSRQPLSVGALAWRAARLPNWFLTLTKSWTRAGLRSSFLRVKMKPWMVCFLEKLSSSVTRVLSLCCDRLSVFFWKNTMELWSFWVLPLLAFALLLCPLHLNFVAQAEISSPRARNDRFYRLEVVPLEARGNRQPAEVDYTKSTIA